MRLIDGDAIYAEIDKFRDVKNMNGFELIQLDCTLAVIKHAKTIDPLKHGHWEFVEKHFDGFKDFACSECGHITDVIGAMPNFCQYCGAKMDMKDE